MTIFYRLNEYSQQRQREKKRWIYPVKLAMQAQHYRNLGHKVEWDPKEPFKLNAGDKIISEPEHINFEHLPAPDRIFTNAKDPKYQSNGNFKYRPGTYIQVADGCWWGKCTFCVEKNNHWRVRSVLDVHSELKQIHDQGFKEVFDDSGSFPIGPWLDEFLSVKNPGIVMGCNCRAVDYPWRRMKHWGFRMVLFGIESANQRTLDRIHKGVRVEDIKKIEDAAKAGLDCHGAFMFGYPWEDDSDAERTLTLAHRLLRKGILKTAQASFYQLQGQPSCRSSHGRFVDKIYDVAVSPQFWINKIKDIKNVHDLKYLMRQIKAGIFHG